MIRPPSGDSAIPASSARKPRPAQAKSGEKRDEYHAFVGDPNDPTSRFSFERLGSAVSSAELARLRLAARGVSAVFGGGFCTVTDPRFFSYRRAPRTGRFASLIWL